MFNLSSSNSVGNRFLAELRDAEIQKDRLRFRRNLERVGEILAYEISQTFDYQPVKVETALGVAQVSVPTNRVVLATILRAGLPFHQGMLNFFDDADNAFISAFRMPHKDGTFEIKLDYVACPDLTGATLILADPMLATGASIEVALKELRRFGEPKNLHIATVIGSAQGIRHIKRLFPKAKIWAGAVDEELTAKSYIVPGLGDAGDLAFGDKI